MLSTIIKGLNNRTNRSLSSRIYAVHKRGHVFHQGFEHEETDESNSAFGPSAPLAPPVNPPMLMKHGFQVYEMASQKGLMY